MNPKIETCNKCSTQCTLEEKSKQIIDLVSRNRLRDIVVIKSKVSLMTQDGNRNGCPQSETTRIKRVTRDALPPQIARFISISHIAITPPKPDLSYGRSSNLSNNKRYPRL